MTGCAGDASRQTQGMRHVKENLRRFREELGIDPVDAARAIGVTRGSVYHWEDQDSKTMPKIPNLLKLSELYGKSVSEILGQPVAPSDKGRVRLTTLEDLQEKGHLEDLRIPSKEARYSPCPFEHGPDTYALEVVSTANQNDTSDSLPLGTLVYMDPDIVPANGQMIAARIASGEVVIRQLVSEGGERFLRALNRDHRRIDMPFSATSKTRNPSNNSPV